MTQITPRLQEPTMNDIEEAFRKSQKEKGGKKK